MLLTGCYNVSDGAGGLLAQNISADISAGAPWAQMALDSRFSWGSASRPSPWAGSCLLRGELKLGVRNR